MSETVIHFHQVVNTPNGKGIVQGRVELHGEETGILVSHDPVTSGEWVRQQPDWKGFWLLRSYDPNLISV